MENFSAEVKLSICAPYMTRPSGLQTTWMIFDLKGGREREWADRSCCCANEKEKEMENGFMFSYQVTYFILLFR